MFGFSTIIYRLVSSANNLTDAWSSFYDVIDVDKK